MTNSVDAPQRDSGGAALPVTREILASQYDGFTDGGVIEENPNDLPFNDMLAIHKDLLANGWRPLRWRHPEMGEQEIVLPIGFWYWRAPNGTAVSVRWGVKHTLREHLGEVVRGPDGVLVVVPQVCKERE